MTYFWKYQRQDYGKRKQYMAVMGKDTCDGFEVFCMGPIFARKAYAEKYCTLANRELRNSDIADKLEQQAKALKAERTVTP